MKNFSFLSVAVVLLILCFHTAEGGNFGEHKLIGDSAFKYYCVNHPGFADTLMLLLGCRPLEANSSLIPLTNRDSIFYSRSRYIGQYPLVILEGKAVTYGDLTALSGDHSPDFIENYTRFLHDTLFGISDLFPKLFDDMLCQFEKELDNLNKGGRGYNPIFLEFINLSITDRSHFHIPATPLRQEIDITGFKTYEAANRFFYSGLTGDAFDAINKQKILDFFGANVVSKYTILHVMAKTYYIQSCNHLRQMIGHQANANSFSQRIKNGDTSEKLAKQYARAVRLEHQSSELAKKYFLLTLFTNAFSEHYLQDMFAAGHFFANRHAADFLGLEAKGIHDYFGRERVSTSIQGKNIMLKGDGNYTEQQLNKAIEANVASLADIFSSGTDLDNPRKPQLDYLHLLQTPAEDPLELFPALKQTPEVPIGEQYSSQRGKIGRSISGSYYGLYGSGSKDFYEAAAELGLYYLLLTPHGCSPVESKFGFGFNFLGGVTIDNTDNDSHVSGRASIGLNLLGYDWIYGNASLTSSLPLKLCGRFEGGLQVKPKKWVYGFRIGVVKYSSGVISHPLLCASIIHF